MPIYEYICKDCGKQFDAIRSIKDADQPIGCRACSSQQARRLISLFFSQSDGQSAGHSHSHSGGCGGCSGGSCSSCGH